MKSLAQHLGRTVWIYFISFALSYVFFSWSLVGAMTSLASGEKFGIFYYLFLLACLLLFAVLFVWCLVFVKIFRELFGVLFPQELRRGPPVGLRALRPGLAVSALKTLSRLDPFRVVFPQAALLVPLVSLGELLLLFYSPSLAIYLFPLYFAFPLAIFVLWIPSAFSRFVTPSQRLLSILSIVQFLRSRKDDLTVRYAKNPFLFEVKQIVGKDERFVIRKASSYFNDFLAEVAPAATANLAKYWATLYVAISLKADDDDEFQKAANTIEEMRQTLESSEDERAKVNQLMEFLASTKDSLRDSWRIVEERNITVETETRLDIRRSLVSVLLAVVPTCVELVRLLFFK